jgi:hypothetical protein
MKQGTKKQTVRKSPHPLDVLLKNPADDSKSIIGTFAQTYAQIAHDRESGGFTETIDYYTSVRREFVRNAKLLVSFNCPPSWLRLLGETELGFPPRDEEVSIRARVFRALQIELQKSKSEKAGISDQFLWQLTELVSGADSEKQLRRDRIIEDRII